MKVVISSHYVTAIVKQWGKPMERSQRMECSPEGIERRVTEMSSSLQQDCCKEESLEKSTGEAEDRDCTAETEKDGEGGNSEG